MDRRITILAVLAAVLVAAVVMALRQPPAPTPELLATVPHVDVVSDDSPPDTAGPQTEPTSANSAQAGAPAMEVAEETAQEQFAEEQQTDFESLVIDGDTFYVYHFHELARTADFYTVIEQLGTDGSSAAAYHYAQLRTELERHRDIQAGTMTIDSMGCGRRLCLISISGPAVSADFRAFSRGIPADSPLTQWFGAVHHVESPNGTELRLMMIQSSPSEVQFRSRRPPDS